MRKITLMLAVLLLLLPGCGSSDIPQIEDYNWIMTSVQSQEKEGQVIAYGEGGSSTLPSAKLVKLSCKADKGNLTLMDHTNGKSYQGSYKFIERDPKSSIYKIVLEGKEGIAVVAMTSYLDGRQDPTFIISLDDYTVNFIGK